MKRFPSGTDAKIFLFIHFIFVLFCFEQTQILL